MVCLKCGFVNDPDADFCENCGSPIASACSSCGAPVKPGAHFCKKCGTLAPSKDRADRLAALQTLAPQDLQQKERSALRQAEGERRTVTILFTDIVGSTALAEKLDPEEWKEIVSGAHRIVSQAVYRYEGTIAQLLGDGVLAFFGAPITHEDDPLRAVRAALDIQHAMIDYERRLHGYLESFQMRIGLNTGTVVMGSVGSDLHMEYLAIGDAVNLAARLQAAAEPGRVLISESTARLVKAAFVLQPLGEISIKGKTEPVAVYEVIEIKANLESRRGFEELRSPLVGREIELAALHHAFKQLRAGLGQIISITGEAGIGKSRLVEEACRLSGEDWQSPGCHSLHWLEGRALSYGQKLSFWTIRQLIQQDLGLSDGDPEIKLHLALRKRTEVLFGGDAIQVLPYLSHLLGVQLVGELAERVKILDGETLKHQTLLSITRYFTRLAEEQPTVLVFDDLHWADPSSLQALEGLLPLTDRVPIMILLLSRLEREHESWELKYKAERQFAHRYIGMELKPLSGDEQNRMVDNLLAIADLPVATRRLILERAEGNPLFLEEIVRDLIEQGAIIQDDGCWRASDNIQDVTIPETLRGVLLARIDRLQEDVRRTLQLASVIGKSFLYSLLEAIAEAEEQLADHLALLQRADLVREKARLPELEYMFKHSLTQDATYQSLLLEQRREFHSKVGQALESLFAERKEEYYGLLAHHFDAAGDTEKAVTYLNHAGDKARLSDEHMEAVRYYQRAVEILEGIGDDDRLARVWLKLGLVYHANFQFEETYQAYEKAFALKQKVRPSEGYSPEASRILRIAIPVYDYCFDPGRSPSEEDSDVILKIFCGLVKMDEELNVIPDMARSWDVLDGGRRYVFHLQQDVRWTNGAPVTAHDYEWAWKHNLRQSHDLIYAPLLYDVRGARDYHESRNFDADSVGVRARDAWTLEVDLEKSVAYFPYIVALPISLPLPSWVIESRGENWWHPEYIQSNGPFRLVEYSPETGYVLERNQAYRGDFSGNVRRIEATKCSPEQAIGAYAEDCIDICPLPNDMVPADVQPSDVHRVDSLRVGHIVMNPAYPPFEDIRVRRAFSLSLDREYLCKVLGIPVLSGGIIPPGMAGHSPDIRFRYHPDEARRLLAQAGFPNGSGLPVIKAKTHPAPRFSGTLTKIADQWRKELGIRIEIEQKGGLFKPSYGICFGGWVADFPDPDTFMRQSAFIHFLQSQGWRNLDYDRLVETAASVADRRQRMAMYRRADRILVEDEVLFIPIWYSYKTRNVTLVKPWVKNFKMNMLGAAFINDVMLEEH